MSEIECYSQYSDKGSTFVTYYWGVITEENVTIQRDTPITEALNQDVRRNNTLTDDDDQRVEQQIKGVVIDSAAGSVKYL